MKTTKEMIEVMQAHADGKKIESLAKDDYLKRWCDCDNPIWDWNTFDYRVKVKYRPYTSVNEMLDDFCEHCREHGMTVSRSPMGEPFIWLLSKDGKTIKLVTDFDEGNGMLKICLNGTPLTFLHIFNGYTYKDGSPCGKKVEE